MRPPIHTSSLRLAEKYYLCRIAQKHRQQRWHPFALLRSVRARCVGTFHNATVRIHDSTKHARAATCQQGRANLLPSKSINTQPRVGFI